MALYYLFVAKWQVPTGGAPRQIKFRTWAGWPTQNDGADLAQLRLRRHLDARHVRLGATGRLPGRRVGQRPARHHVPAAPGPQHKPRSTVPRRMTGAPFPSSRGPSRATIATITVSGVGGRRQRPVLAHRYRRARRRVPGGRRYRDRQGHRADPLLRPRLRAWHRAAGPCRHQPLRRAEHQPWQHVAYAAVLIVLAELGRVRGHLRTADLEAGHVATAVPLRRSGRNALGAEPDLGFLGRAPFAQGSVKPRTMAMELQIRSLI